MTGGSGASHRRSTPAAQRSSRSSVSPRSATAARRSKAASARTKTVKPRNNPRGSHAPKGKRPQSRVRRILKWVFAIIGGLIATGLVAGIAAFSYLWITTEIPQPEKFALAEKTTVYYSDGTTKVGSFGDQNRDIIECSVLPDYVGNAIVASENRSFYTDKGIDLKGIARALLTNITTGSRQGGSTITQQYAERYYMGSNTTYVAKAREAVLALKIAQQQDKSEVLCNYMNTIYLGRGAYGIQAAAQAYFAKDAKDLTVSEAAMLAGIIPAPSAWDPAVNPERAESRFERVIDIMAEDGYITPQQKAEAAMPTTIEQQQTNDYQGTNGYLLQMVRDELLSGKTFTADDLDTGGYKIITTIDKDKQALMLKTASKTQGDNSVKPDDVEIGSINVDPKTGRIIAFYGGDDYLTKQLNNATQATYEVGSTMKPFALLKAVEEGVSLNTTFNGNSPRDFSGLSTPMANAAGVSYGTINLYQATANSVNTVYMDVAQHLGSAAIADTAHRAGIKGDISDEDPYTVLGNAGLSVLDMARGYATIANQGKKPTLHVVSNVQDGQGQELYQEPTNTEEVFDANDVALVTKAMTGVVQYGSGSSARAVGLTQAGKTGTANDNKAISFVGFTPSTLTIFAVWHPGPNGEALEIPAINGWQYSARYAVYLYTQYMKQATAGMDNESFPTATDTGKIGGPDGTWGTNGRRSSDSDSDADSDNDTTGDSETDDAGNTTGNNGNTTGENTPSNGTGDNGSTGEGSNGTGSGTTGSGGTDSPGNGNNSVPNTPDNGTGGAGPGTADTPSTGGSGTETQPNPGTTPESEAN